MGPRQKATRKAVARRALGRWWERSRAVRECAYSEGCDEWEIFGGKKRSLRPMMRGSGGGFWGVEAEGLERGLPALGSPSCREGPECASQ